MFRPGKVKGRALAKFGLQPNRTTFGFDDFFDNCQPDPRTVRSILGIDCLEDLEHPLLMLWGNALAVISDRKFIEIATLRDRNLNRTSLRMMMFDTIAD